MKLKTKFILTFLTAALLPLVLFGLIVFKMGENFIQKDLSFHFQQKAAEAVSLADRQLSVIYDNAANLADIEIMQEVLTGDIDGKISLFLADISRKNSQISRIFVLDDNGEVAASNVFAQIGRSYQRKGFYQKAFSGGVYTEDVHFDQETREWVATFSFPVKSKVMENRIIGVFCAQYRLDELCAAVQAMIKQSGLGYGQLFLLRQDGLVILAPQARRKDIYARNLFSEGFKPAILSSRGQEGYLFERAASGRNLLIGYSYSKGYHDFPGLGWTAIFLEDASLAFASTQQLKILFLGLGGVVVFMVIFMAVAIARRMNAPILKIAAAAQRVAKGDFGAVVDYVSGDEIGLLAKTFNRMTRDIAEQRDQLTQERDYVDSIITNTMDILIVLDAKGMIKTVNRAALDLLGYSQEMLIDQSFSGIVADQEDFFTYTFQLEDSIQSAEVFYLSRDGKKIPMLFSSSVVRNNEGLIRWIICAAKDITERKRAEEEIRQNLDTQNVISALLYFSLEDIALEKVFSRALDLILAVPWLAFKRKGAIFLTEGDSGVLVMKAQVGFLPEERGSCERVDFGRCICGLAAAMRKLQFFDSFDERHQIKSKVAVEHAHYCVPILRGQKILGVLNVYTEEAHNRVKKEEDFLTTVVNALAGIIIQRQTEEERKKIQTELLQSQKMDALGKLAGGIAHDFNNLLMLILGYSELTQEYGEDKDLARQSISEIAKAGKRAESLVRQLLAFSRRQAFAPKALDLNLVVVNMEKMLRRLISENIRLGTRLKEGLGFVKGDVGQLEQVIMNLAVNARDAMSSGGELTIATDSVVLTLEEARIYKEGRAGHFACLSVTDTGCGMDAAVLAKIFEPFFSTKDPQKGTGLGLSVIYGIVKQHEGWIDVSSRPDRGSVFRVFLPVTAPEDVRAEKQETARQDLLGKGERVLLVEDDEKVRAFIKRVLSDNGYAVTEASTEAGALKIFEKEEGRFCLVFADIVLPDKSGFQLVDELSKKNPELRVLLTTGYMNQDVPQSLLAGRKILILQKPFSITELLSAVKKTIENKR